jgi:hypothetical protein
MFPGSMLRYARGSITSLIRNCRSSSEMRTGWIKPFSNICTRGGYRNVEVFCSGGLCRNNLGRWEVRSVLAGTRERNVTFYSAKDRMMTQEAMVGLMIWDGKSIGTLLNVFRLLSQNKKVVVYNIPEKRFQEIKTGVAGWDAFIARCDAEVQHRVEARARREASERRLPAQASLSI